MSSAFRHVDADALRSFCESVFVTVGMSNVDAQVQSDVLVWANLRGVDSHGALRVPRYVDWLKRGTMNPRPNIEVVSETPACRPAMKSDSSKSVETVSGLELIMIVLMP